MKITVNDIAKDLDVNPQKPLLWVIRENFELTGTKFSCGRGLCGACTVEVEGGLVRSCTFPVSAAQNKSVQTIEHKRDAITQAVQQAWVEKQVPQCGYCQSGQVMAASHLLQRTARPSNEEIDGAMVNLCRCGTYPRIKAGIQRAVEILNPADSAMVGSDHRA